MDPLFWKIGLACILFAIVGGGAKLFGLEVPAIQSTKRQGVLAAVGALLIALFVVGPYIHLPVGQSESIPPKFIKTWHGKLFDTSIDQNGARSLGNITVDVTIPNHGAVTIMDFDHKRETECKNEKYGDQILSCDIFLESREVSRKMRLSIEGGRLRVWVQRVTKIGDRVLDGEGPDGVYDNLIPN